MGLTRMGKTGDMCLQPIDAKLTSTWDEQIEEVGSDIAAV